MALFSKKSPADAAPKKDAPPLPKGAAGEDFIPGGIHVPRFGASGKARELAAEVQRLSAELNRFGAMEVIDLERRRDELRAEIVADDERQRTAHAEYEAVLERERLAAEEQQRAEVDRLGADVHAAQAMLTTLQAQIVTTEEVALLQEAGVYEYRHPLDDSVAYKGELARLKDQVKAMAKANGGAVLGSTDWQVNGSAAQGRKMIRDFSKLMLRAYNAEADTLIRGLKPYKLVSATERLGKVREAIARLGGTMGIEIASPYHRLRIRELELTADYLEKLAEEKEREREERERLREERKAQQEMERERARLEKERHHYENALRALEEKGDEGAAARMREELAEVDRKIEDVDYRAANIRAGYVYVISNIGSFGDRIVKIGLTRRLEPLDRVRELGDASVPFRFDIHALFFSNDAVGIETQLHERLADRRVNRVNTRREFFYATPEEVKTHLLELAGEILQFDDLAEAVEFRQSQTTTASDPLPTDETAAGAPSAAG